MTGNILAIDQGTSSTRSIVFDEAFAVRGVGQLEFDQHFPKSGWVEHAPADLFDTTVQTVRQAMEAARVDASGVAAIGITNQRETTLVWNRKTGEPLYNAIVWQDRRTAEKCASLKNAGHEAMVSKKTGLLLDPYFSATKVAWILDTVPGARDSAEAGDLAFGTVDTWLIWKLTNGKRHVTDATNAARTMLYNIVDGVWDDDLLALFGIPESMMPEVLESADDFGVTDKDVIGFSVPICGVAGDQQAATVGQACFNPGMMKSTYGTGCFALMNTGLSPVSSRNRLLTTIAYQLDGKTFYALEGAIFVAGAAVQWLRDGLGILPSADRSGDVAAQADPNSGVYLVPAFTGLGAPHWDPSARGALYGLTRATGPAEFVRAALESVCFQTADLLGAMQSDWGKAEDTILRVDGGMVASDWTMQCLADMLDAPVDRPQVLETTALGAAWLAGYRAGVWPDQEGFANAWKLDRRFTPSMDADERQRRLDGWHDAVRRTLTA